MKNNIVGERGEYNEDEKMEIEEKTEIVWKDDPRMPAGYVPNWYRGSYNWLKNRYKSQKRQEIEKKQIQDEIQKDADNEIQIKIRNEIRIYKKTKTENPEKNLPQNTQNLHNTSQNPPYHLPREHEYAIVNITCFDDEKTKFVFRSGHSLYAQEEFFQIGSSQKHFFLRCLDHEEYRYTISGDFGGLFLRVDKVYREKLEIDFNTDPQTWTLRREVDNQFSLYNEDRGFYLNYAFDDWGKKTRVFIDQSVGGLFRIQNDIPEK